MIMTSESRTLVWISLLVGLSCAGPEEPAPAKEAGGKLVAVLSPVPPVGSLSWGGPCTLAPGASTCDVQVSWSASGDTNVCLWLPNGQDFACGGPTGSAVWPWASLQGQELILRATASYQTRSPNDPELARLTVYAVSPPPPYAALPTVTLSGVGGALGLGWWVAAGGLPDLATSSLDALVAINQSAELAQYGALGQRFKFLLQPSAGGVEPLLRGAGAGHLAVGLNHRFSGTGNTFAGMILGNDCGAAGGFGLEWKLANGTTLSPGTAGNLGAPQCESIPPQVTSLLVEITARGDNGWLRVKASDPNGSWSAEVCGLPRQWESRHELVSSHAGLGVAGLGPIHASVPSFAVSIVPLEQELLYAPPTQDACQ